MLGDACAVEAGIPDLLTPGTAFSGEAEIPSLLQRLGI